MIQGQPRGYGPASKLAKEALATNANIADLVVASGLLTREQVTKMLSPGHLTALTENGPRETIRKAS